MNDSTVLGKLDWHGHGSSCLCQFISSLETVSAVHLTLGNSDSCYSDHCKCTALLSVVMFLLSGEGDLRDVISVVTSLAGRWKDLGICLGVCPSDLDTILSDNPHSSSNCLREMLLQWLRQRYNVCTIQSPPHLIYITQSLY